MGKVVKRVFVPRLAGTLLVNEQIEVVAKPGKFNWIACLNPGLSAGLYLLDFQSHLPKRHQSPT